MLFSIKETKSFAYLQKPGTSENNPKTAETTQEKLLNEPKRPKILKLGKFGIFHYFSFFDFLAQMPKFRPLETKSINFLIF